MVFVQSLYQERLDQSGSAISSYKFSFRLINFLFPKYLLNFEKVTYDPKQFLLVPVLSVDQGTRTWSIMGAA